MKQTAIKIETSVIKAADKIARELGLKKTALFRDAFEESMTFTDEAILSSFTKDDHKIMCTLLIRDDHYNRVASLAKKANTSWSNMARSIISNFVKDQTN